MQPFLWLVGLTALAWLSAGCSLPGYQGGPMPRSTQYTYPGLGFHPESGVARSGKVEVVEADDGGSFTFGLVFADGSTGRSVEAFTSRAACETGRTHYDALTAERVKEGAARVMTVKCYRTHDTSGHQTR